MSVIIKNKFENIEQVDIATNHFCTIQVICNSVRTSSIQTSRFVNVAYLVNIYPISVIRNEATYLTVSLFNAQSVCQPEKRVSICDFICDADVDILFLTETWLNLFGDEAKCIVAMMSCHFPD